MILVMPSLEWDLQFLTGPVSVTCVETGLGRNQNLIHQNSSIKLMFSKSLRLCASRYTTVLILAASVALFQYCARCGTARCARSVFLQCRSNGVLCISTPIWDLTLSKDPLQSARNHPLHQTISKCQGQQPSGACR